MSSLSLDPIPTTLLQDRYARVKERIARAAEKSGRSPNDICLVAVTKTVAVETITEAFGLGIKDIGENRIQEATAKNDLLDGAIKRLNIDGVSRHLLGQLQTNKARKAVALFDVIQSVDRPRLAEFLDRVAGEEGKTQRCLIEVKVSREETKSGMPLDEASDFIRSFKKYPRINLEGIMTIGPLQASVDETRVLFRRCAEVFHAHRGYFGERPVLSMGMSDDFEMAIEEGSTMVRIGRGLFGERI
jgi:PLP dependent protein